MPNIGFTQYIFSLIVLSFWKFFNSKARNQGYYNEGQKEKKKKS